MAVVGKKSLNPGDPILTGGAGSDVFDAPAGNAGIDAFGGIDTVKFNFRLVDATVNYDRGTVIIDTATSHTELTGIERYVFTDGTVEENDGNPLVDDLYYYSHYHDVWTSGADADAHFAQFGWHEDRNPSAFFNTIFYLVANPDVAAAGVNPLEQFHQSGWKEGRLPSVRFDTFQYLQNNPDIAAAGVDPLEQFLDSGGEEGRLPYVATAASAVSPSGFDYGFYLLRNPDVAAAGIDPLQHFDTFGWKEGRDPNAYFDTRGYLATYADVAAAGVNPFEHFITFGWREGRDPSPAFDTSAYLLANPDVAAAGVDPLVHYLREGVHEGRTAFATALANSTGPLPSFLPEGAAAGTGTGIDVNWGGWVSSALFFSIVGDSSGGGFAIDAATGVVTVADGTKLDFETSGVAHSHIITVQAQNGTVTDTQDFAINIIDVVPTPPVDSNAAANVVAEGAAAGTAVGVTLFSNEPNGPPAIYSLTDDAGGRFAVDPNTGIVTVSDPALIDFESSGPSHQFTISGRASTSGGTFTLEQSFTITITDVAPTAPTDGNGAPNTVFEGSANGTLAGLTAGSSDPNGPAPIFSLTDSAGGRFAIDSATGIVTVANGALLDHEAAASHSITVQATAGALSSSQTFVIAVGDVNDNPPVFASSATPSVAENTTVVVTLATTDADTANPPIFTITGGADQALFTITGGNQLQFVSPRDFETQTHSYAVQITANDGANSTIQNLTVTLTDQNDNAPAFASTATPSIARDTTAVVSLTTTDADTVGTNPPVFTITGGADAGLFSIEGANQLQFITPPVSETPQTYLVQVTADDGANRSVQNLTVALAEVSGPPVIGTVTIDGNPSDWTAAQRLDAGSPAGYALYGQVIAGNFIFGIEDDAGVIGPGTVIRLDSDRNSATGFQVFGNTVGAEYSIAIGADGLASLYTGDGQTPLGSVIYAISADGHGFEVALPESAVGGSTAANVFAAVNGSTNLPENYSAGGYRVGSLPATTVGSITLDGALTDWNPGTRLDAPANNTSGYGIYGQVQNDTFLFALSGPNAIGNGTTIWLNSDFNRSTGFQIPFGAPNLGGAEYNINIGTDGTPRLYTGGAGQTPVAVADLAYNYSADRKSIEIALPSSYMAGSPAGAEVLADVNDLAFLPGDYTQPYIVAQSLATGQSHRVAIVYSDTSANLYFNQTAYSDLIMAAQNQARMAGVQHDLIDESQLTDISNLTQYSALIFPSMANVNTAQLPAIVSTLTSAVYNYHIDLIAAGDFLTNDQTGAPLPGNAYANMELLLGLNRFQGGNDANVTITAAATSNPIMQSYTAGQLIQTYTDAGYNEYRGATAQVLVNQNVAGVGTLPGVVQTTTGGTNVHFATTSLLGDSNLLSNAIQKTVQGTQPTLTLDTSRQSGIFAMRMDMDQSQFRDDVSPGAGRPGIYDVLVPILQGWKNSYNFVGTYFVNIGDNPAADQTTLWSVSLPYYQAIQAMGGEIGSHSLTHLLDPPTLQDPVTGALSGWTATAHATTAAAPGSTQITLDSLPSFSGVTVGMIVTGPGIGTNTTVLGSNGETVGVANTFVTAVSGNTITIGYFPGGSGGRNAGTIADIPTGATLTFGIPTENTNFLQTSPSSVVGIPAGSPFTYAYEFGQSKTDLQANIPNTTIYGAAVPGAPETLATSRNIMAYYPSVAGQYTGYVSGGWTGIGAGYPNAIGYMSPTDQSAVYIAPNMTFDFTEIQFQGKTVAQAVLDWQAQFNAIAANSAGTPIAVFPIHDYAVATWNSSTGDTTGSPYTTQMFADVIGHAFDSNFEFVTLEDLASRISASQKAHISYSTTGSTVTATVTPDPAAPDVGTMALGLINGGTNIIQNATIQTVSQNGGWYAYDTQKLFLPQGGGTFTVNIGTAQDDLSHLSALPMRADLQTVTGDGTDLGFSFDGSGTAIVDVKGQGTSTAIVTGADNFSRVEGKLSLGFTKDGLHTANVDVTTGNSLVAGAGLAAGSSVTAGNTIVGTAANELIVDGSNGDTISTGGGTDQVFGGGGNDVFVFTHGSGNMTVEDFATTFDKLDLSGLGFGSTEFAASQFVGGSAGLTLAVGNDTLVLAGIQVGGLAASDILRV